MRPALPDQGPGLNQCPDALLEEKRIPFGLRDEARLEWGETGIVPQEHLEEFFGARRRERLQAELGIVRLGAPALLIRRATGHQEQKLGAWQALDQAVEHHLGLSVDPV